MKVLLVNGSPHKKGTTNAALEAVAEQLGKEGAVHEIFWVGRKPYRAAPAAWLARSSGNARSAATV